jgi:benzoyl-CoA reductase/2-hydroxyglutaryl-CoA dehydratase subunit BcrC/BadD/HgdB
MINLLFSGQKEGTVYLEMLRNELIGKIAQKNGSRAQERFRLINMNLPPLYFIGSLEKIFEEYGAVEVVNPFFLEWQDGELDPRQPLSSLAKKSLMNPLMRVYTLNSQQMLDDLKRNIKDYRIDGAINYAHIGCASFGGISRLVRDTMKEAGVPILDLACDITDPTVASPEEMRDQLYRFFEQLEDS